RLRPLRVAAGGERSQLKPPPPSDEEQGVVILREVGEAEPSPLPSPATKRARDGLRNPHPYPPPAFSGGRFAYAGEGRTYSALFAVAAYCCDWRGFEFGDRLAGQIDDLVAIFGEMSAREFIGLLGSAERLAYIFEAILEITERALRLLEFLGRALVALGELVHLENHLDRLKRHDQRIGRDGKYAQLVQELAQIAVENGFHVERLAGQVHQRHVGGAAFRADVGGDAPRLLFHDAFEFAASGSERRGIARAEQRQHLLARKFRIDGEI